ncbi:MAG: hypothetical protein AAB785_01730 [Patescibacteria group bacterium]
MANFPKVFNLPQEPKKKSPIFKKIIVIGCLIIVLISAIGYLLFFSSVFRIKNVIVADQIKSVYNWENLKNKNLLTLKTADLKKDILEKSPELVDISLVRGLPDTLKIEINTDQPKIIWQTQERKYFVNAQGLIFQEVNGQTDLPLVQDDKNLAVLLMQKVASVNFVNFVENLNTKFSSKNGFKIVYFRINETVFQIDALTEKGYFVKFDTTREIDRQLDDLSKFLEKYQEEIHEYADVRIEGKVYYK